MKYVINNFWNQDKPIDWDRMQKILDICSDLKRDDIGFVAEQWFKIDEYTHGSITIFDNKEVFELVCSTLKADEKEQNERGIKKIYEFVGGIKAARVSK